MDILAAVNIMREKLGEPPASALQTGQNTLTGRAEAELEAANERVQLMRLWAFNTFKNREFEPDAGDNDRIDLGTDPKVLYVRVEGGATRHEVSLSEGRYLYNSKENTEEWPDIGSICLTIQYLWPFESLSPNMQWFVVYEAARNFAATIRRGQIDAAFLQREYNGAKVNAYRENADLDTDTVLNTANQRLLAGRPSDWHLRRGDG